LSRTSATVTRRSRPTARSSSPARPDQQRGRRRRCGCSPTRARARCACRSSRIRPAASTPATPAIALGKGGQPARPITTPDSRRRADAHLWQSRDSAGRAVASRFQSSRDSLRVSDPVVDGWQRERRLAPAKLVCVQRAAVAAGLGEHAREDALQQDRELHQADEYGVAPACDAWPDGTWFRE